MKKVSIITLLTLFLLTGFQSFAQKPGESVSPKDPKAKAILDKVSAKNETYTSLYMNFTFRLINKVDGVDETQKGEVWMKGDKYKMTLPGILRVSDGTTIWTYLEDDDECQIYSADGDENEDASVTPSQMLTMYEKGFNYMYDKETKIDGKTLDVIKLFPEKGGKPYHTIKIYIDRASNQIYRLEILNKDGNTFIYTLSNINTTMKMDDSMFVFDISKAGDVNDFRD